MLAPLLCARLAALVMRLSQSLFTPEEVSLMSYVDDPLAVLNGTEGELRVHAAMIVLVWEVLGSAWRIRKSSYLRLSRG